jgi:hypothetical protein
MLRLVCVLALSVAVVASLPARGDEVGDLLKDLRATRAQGAGSPAARAAWDRLVRQGPAVLPRILEAMDTPDVVVANWLRTAFDRIAEPELARGGKQIDAAALLAFVRDAKHEGRARRLALDVVERLRPGTRARLVPGWLEDPEFRYDAVQRALRDLDRDKNIPRDKAVAILRRAFASTRDLEQGRALAARLKALGVTVSVADHFGFLRDWYVIGPFDAHGMKGFRTAYPPEQKVDLAAGYEGKDGNKLRWKRFTAPEGPTVPYSALVNLREPLGDAADAVAYAYTAFTAPEGRAVEFRGAADDNLSVWVNGEKVFAFEEYRNGIRLDRHRFRARLRKGVNTVLVKVCQANPEPNWEFILRVVDAAGRGLVFPGALPPRGEESR